MFVSNNEDAAVAAAHSVDPTKWWDGFGQVLDRISGRFTRYETRRNAASLMLGLLTELDRKNCWTIAEQRGHATPDRLQHLLSRAVWDHAGVARDLRDYVMNHLGDPSAILILDETGHLKKGTDSVGVQRQYTGTAGRIENAQVTVHLAYAAPVGHSILDRALYLPKSWTQDRERCRRAGIPDDVQFATKPALGTQMITAALDAGVPASWVAGDEVYGADPDLRQTLQDRQIGYVLAIAGNRRVTTRDGRTRTAAEVCASTRKRSWHRLSAGAGAHGQRWYSWSRTRIDTDQPGQHWLLVRRNDRTGELAYYRAFSPRPVRLQQLVTVAGQRWRVEESFQTSKGLTGLDQHQVRTWTSWHRWTVLVLLAHAFLVVVTAATREAAPTPENLIPLTINEFRRLFDAAQLRPAHTMKHRLAWSQWRRQRQAQARACHYRRRAETP